MNHDRADDNRKTPPAGGGEQTERSAHTSNHRPVHWAGRSTNFDEFKRTTTGIDASLITAAVESANDAIIITEARLDAPGPRIEFVNPAFERMTGYGVEEVIGQTPRILQGSRTDRNLIRRLRSDLENSRLFHGETINYRKDGTEYHVEWRITPLTDDAGNVVKWVAIQRDVSERVQAEEERSRLLHKEQIARAEAEHQSRMKDEFLATLSHELRTPLTAIVGWSSLLRRSAESEDARNGLSVIERNARAQAQLIEDLLDMSRIITGKLRLDVQRVDVSSVIEAAVASVKHGADAKGVRIHKVVDPLAGPVTGDPARLQQVLWNLLSNAVKFTPNGGRVQIVAERVSSSVEVSVSDNGVGIQPEFLPYVFDRFRQADSTTTRQYSGLGLGLAIVKQIVELHGGQVRAKSPGAGEGATFIVALPLTLLHTASAEDTAAKAQPADPEDGECPPSLQGARVLLVDDEPDMRDLVERVLSDCGVRVTVAASAADALKALDKEVPDVLISDVGMPDRDGYELIRAVRRRSPRDGRDVPAVAVTAFARAEDRRRALTAGFDMHVAKPVDPDDLLAVVARLAVRRNT